MPLLSDVYYLSRTSSRSASCDETHFIRTSVPAPAAGVPFGGFRFCLFLFTPSSGGLLLTNTNQIVYMGCFNRI